MASRVHRGPFAIALVLTLTLAVSADFRASAQAPAPARGGAIVVAIGGEPPHLNPHFTTLPWVWMAGMGIFNSLVQLDPAMTPRPGLAAHLPAPM